MSWRNDCCNIKNLLNVKCDCSFKSGQTITTNIDYWWLATFFVMLLLCLRSTHSVNFLMDSCCWTVFSCEKPYNSMRTSHFVGIFYSAFILHRKSTNLRRPSLLSLLVVGWLNFYISLNRINLTLPPPISPWRGYRCYFLNSPCNIAHNFNIFFKEGCKLPFTLLCPPSWA